MTRDHTTSCSFIPPFLMERVDPDLRGRDAAFREARRLTAATLAPPLLPSTVTGASDWVVHDCGNTGDLPGRVARTSGEPETGDPAVDEAATGISASLALFAEVYGRDSYDGAGATVSLSVHYERDYANAFWDGTQLVFGDGDGRIFERFTKPVDVLGHEFAHAVTERTAGLVYEGQSGALNESLSDVFGLCMKQRLLGQGAAEASWVVGEGLFRPGVSGRGLRDMRHPGTAYDDPRLGRDPQPAHMDDYVRTTDDNGGVHINSGIPNRAFVLAAEAIGGSAAEGAGRIWFAAMTDGAVGPRTDFAGFAAATVAAAGEHADAVRRAWEGVGVTAATGRVDVPTPGGEVPPPARRVRVRRSGGFAGIPVEAEVDLDAGADERAGELRDLVARVDVASLTGVAEPRPDRFVYDLDLCGTSCRVQDSELTPELRRIVDLVLP